MDAETGSQVAGELEERERMACSIAMDMNEYHQKDNVYLNVNCPIIVCRLSFFGVELSFGLCSGPSVSSTIFVVLGLRIYLQNPPSSNMDLPQPPSLSS